MKKFEIIDISGDIGIKAFGSNIKELFENAAVGMYSLITDIGKIREIKSTEISAKGLSTESLFVSWLNELIFHFDAYGFIGKAIDIREHSDTGIRAIVTGEEFDPARHEGKLLIKAATYHKLKVTKTSEGWEAEVIFDI